MLDLHFELGSESRTERAGPPPVGVSPFASLSWIGGWIRRSPRYYSVRLDFAGRIFAGCELSFARRMSYWIGAGAVQRGSRILRGEASDML